jgi:hypothetical protein
MDATKIELADWISGMILTPGDDEYEDSLKRWASNSERRAAYVVVVESADDISETVMPTPSANTNK